MRKISLAICPGLLATLLTFSAANADEEARDTTAASDKSGSAANTEMTARNSEDMREEAQEAQDQVNEAVKVVNRMKTDAKLVNLLQRAQGVFIVPTYGKGAAVVGARGGEGVLLLRNGAEWSGPAFYDFGSVSIGAQAGGAGGSIAMLLLTDRAVDSFKRGKNNFSLDANAGVTFADYSRAAQESLNKSDIVVWSDTRGLFGGASLGISDIRRDDGENRGYYQQRASIEQIFAGSVTNPHADALREELPTRTASR